MQLKDIKIGQRLGAAFAIVLLFLAAITAIGLFGINKTFESSKAMYNNATLPLVHLSTVEFLTTRNRVLVMDMILQNKPDNTAKRASELAKNVEKVNVAWAAFTASARTPQEQALAKTFATTREAYLKQGLLPTKDAMLADKHDEALAA